MALTFKVHLTNHENQSNQPQKPAPLALKYIVWVVGLPREGAEGSCGLGCLTAGLEIAAEAELVVQEIAVEGPDGGGDSNESGEKEDHVEEFKDH